MSSLPAFRPLYMFSRFDNKLFNEKFDWRLVRDLRIPFKKLFQKVVAYKV